MAEGQVKQVLEKEITCPLCLDIFKEPKKLPCDHIYCKECITRLAQLRFNGTISCPECRFIAQPLNGDINNFPTAFHINRLSQAFSQLQAASPGAVQEEAKTLLLSNMCKNHTTQPLVFYCETCKTSLCPDCVLGNNKDHEKHKYSFFREIAPDFRKKLLSELSSLKVKETTIVAALKEVVDASNSVVSHEDKCQEDIDAAFEEMFSALRQCKQEMKSEARKHYSSLTGVFESKKAQLETLRDELKEIGDSVIASAQDDDQKFLMAFESKRVEMKNLDEKIITVNPRVILPQLLTAQASNSEVLLRHFRKLCTLYNLANSQMCEIEEIVTEMQVDREESFFVTLNDSADKMCKGGENRVRTELVNVHGNSTKGIVETVSSSRVKINFIPERRGRHKLKVKVNGAHIKSSPITVFVNIPPRLLSQPVTTVLGLKNPTGLIYSQEKIVATEKRKDRIVTIDSQHEKQELVRLVEVTGLTQDSKFNLYATTVSDHRVHKLSECGQSIKVVGQFGKKNGEFNFPNGLRVSKKDELYVCDSGNNRIQVFNLGLKFKRSFGKKGTGKGQFDFPSDVDFDTNGCIYVVDNGNGRIQVFTHNERHLQTIGNQKPISTKFDPVRILVNNNHLYITDYYNHYIVVLTITGEIVTKFGGEFLCEPEGITVDSDGFVYVTSHHSKVVVF